MTILYWFAMWTCFIFVLSMCFHDLADDGAWRDIFHFWMVVMMGSTPVFFSIAYVITMYAP